MQITCKQCSSTFRAAVASPLTQPVRVICPSCGKQMVLRPAPEHFDSFAGQNGDLPLPSWKRRAVIADQPREFRDFLVRELSRLGFEVSVFETGEQALAAVRSTRAELVILNVYLQGKLGVDISEEIKADESLSRSKVVLIGALFRANRFRANATNLYGADEYIEEQIPAQELQRIIEKLFPGVSSSPEVAPEAPEIDQARRLARLILSDIIIYNAEKVERGVRDDDFFDLLRAEIEDGREYYESRVPASVRESTDFFNETLHHFVQMKREELARQSAGTASE